MSTTTQGLTSDVIPPLPFSKDELREQWNAQADVDKFNHWDNLGLDEQLAWAQTRVIEALRPLLYQVARIAGCFGHDTISEIPAISSKAATWLEENPPGRPAGIEPRGCPPPGVPRDPPPPAVSADRSRYMRQSPDGWEDAADATEQATTIRYEFKVLDENGLIEASGDAATLKEAERKGRHYLVQYQQDGPRTLELRRTEVLSVSTSQPTPAAAESLWRVMVRAYNNAPELPDGIGDRQMLAAEIVAARNWLKRRLPEGGAWYVLLTTEADRAGRGE